MRRSIDFPDEPKYQKTMVRLEIWAYQVSEIALYKWHARLC